MHGRSSRLALKEDGHHPEALVSKVQRPTFSYLEADGVPLDFPLLTPVHPTARPSEEPSFQRTLYLFA